jgi:YidC/Oxa1 family membrane protein insertase
MTMTDMDTYAYKRSKEVNCYVYVFHAMVSTHLQYTGKAFFHYDAVFCPGPAHVYEIKATEKKYGLRQKDTVNYGYPLLDVLKKQQQLQKGSSRPTILIAPSWYRECILETCIEELVQQLSALPYNIVIRPHPEYVKRRKKKMVALQQRAEKLSTVSIDYSPLVTPALLEADILITDRSGVAFEYALGMQKPVLFIETPLKIMNPAWEELGLPPVENQYRERMGVTVLPGELSSIKDKIATLESMKPSFPQQMELLQKELLFNSDASYSSGVDYILSKIKR